MTTFTVTSLRGAGEGSLRQAIVASNRQPGHDTIEFDVAGTIRVGPRALPTITDPVTLDGTSAPSFGGSPVVTVDFRGTRGLHFGQGADGSNLLGLSLVRAGGAGVTLDASHVTIQGSFIGVMADGRTVAGNRGDGIRINASSHDNMIGQDNPVSGVSYYNSDSVGLQPVSGWQGIRNSDTPGQYIITGTSDSNGLLYIGPISGIGGTSYAVNVPGAQDTSVYGPDLVGGDVLRLVGSYKTGDGQVQGFLFQGTLDDLNSADHYRTIDYTPDAKVTYVHSTMGGLAVGNGGDIAPETDHAFLYSIPQDKILTDIVYPGSTTSSAYGIWHNGGSSYTIVGGYSKLGDLGAPLSAGFIVDYDAATGQFLHWTSLSAPGATPGGQSLVTHFEGISSPRPGFYTLAAGISELASNQSAGAAVATVERNPDGSFGTTHWVNLSYPGAVGLTTSNSVAGNQVVGIAQMSTGFVSYQATINLNPRISNVISGNRGNGVGIYGGTNTWIAMNNIGTDAIGGLDLGNARNGILLTQGASENLIGGPARNPQAGPNDRPPQANLIIGNRGEPIRSNRGAADNIMIGNLTS